MSGPTNGHAPFDEILRRVQGEFLEMPGLRLTVAQAQRLWNLEAFVCEALLQALVDARFLARVRGDAFVRAHPSSPDRPFDGLSREP
jgi:hypothetical protein